MDLLLFIARMKSLVADSFNYVLVSASWQSATQAELFHGYADWGSIFSSQNMHASVRFHICICSTWRLHLQVWLFLACMFLKINFLHHYKLSMTFLQQCRSVVDSRFEERFYKF